MPLRRMDLLEGACRAAQAAVKWGEPGSQVLAQRSRPREKAEQRLELVSKDLA